MSKPKFDPSKPYEAVDAKPRFDASKPYEAVAVEEAAATDPSPWESAGRGFIQGASMGFGDELAGGLEAAGSLVGVRGLGGSFADIRRATDDESKQSLGDAYRQARDMRRAQAAEAERANPKAFLAGDLTGSLAGGLGVAGKVPGALSTIKGAAAMGAAQGAQRAVGDSETDLSQDLTPEKLTDAYGEALAGGAVGGALGGGGAAVAKGASVAAKATKDAFGKASQYVRAASRGAKSGAKAAADAAPDAFGAKHGAALFGSVKGALQEAMGVPEAGREIATIAREARKIAARPLQELGGEGRITATGAGKTLDPAALSDDEAILVALLDEGENPVKTWLASRAAMSRPGQIDQGQYARLLALGPDARSAARSLDKKEAAKALKPELQAVQELFEDARSSRYGQLQSAARASFNPDAADNVFASLSAGIEDAGRLQSVPKSARKVLADVQGMLEGGVGTRSQGLVEGPWGAADAGERFMRLQRARELVDGQIKWAAQKGKDNAQAILKEVRGSIDAALKTSPEKIEGDALYAASKGVEQRFFGPTEFRDAAGRIDVDEFKLAKLLNDNDQAGRFRNALAELRDFAAREDLPSKFRTRANELADQIGARMEQADHQRALTAFRQAQGPTSPAVERMASAAQGNSLVRDALDAPAGFLSSADQLDKFLRTRLGKGFGELGEAEKASAVRYWAWVRGHPEATQGQTDAAFRKLFGK